MKRLRLVLLGLAAFALLFLVLKAPVVDRYLEAAIPRWAAAADYRVRLESLQFDPWGPRLELQGLTVEPHGDAPAWRFSAAAVQLRLLAWRSLSGRPHLRTMLRGPEVQVTLGGASSPEHGRGPLPALPVVFETLQVTAGRFSLDVPQRDLVLSVPSIEVDWVNGRGGARLGDIRVLWRGAEERLGQVEFSGERRYAATRVEQFQLSGPRMQLAVSGRVGPWRLLDLELQAEVAAADLPPPWLAALHLERFAPLSGVLTLQGALRGRSHDPRFEGAVRLRGGRFGPVAEAELTAQVQADSRGVEFDAVTGSSTVAAVESVRGGMTWGPPWQLRAAGRVVEYRLRPFMGLFVRRYFPVGLVAGGDFRVEGRLAPQLELDCRVDGWGRDLDVTVEAADGSRTTYFDLPTASVRTQAVVEARRLRVGPTHITAPSLDLEVPAGEVTYRQGLWFETRGEIRDLQLARRYLPPSFDARGRVQGRFGGPYRELQFEYDVDLESTVVLGQDLGRLQGRARYDLRDLELIRARLEGPLGQLTTKGRATLRPGGQHRWWVDWQQGDLASVAAVLRGMGVDPVLPLQGAVGGRGRVLGPLLEPRYQGWLEGTALCFADGRCDRWLAGGTFGRDRWDLAWAEAEVSGAALRGAGGGDREGFDAKITVHHLDLASALAARGSDLPVAGVFGGELSLFGPYAQPTASLRGTVRSAVAYGAALDDVELDLFLRRQQLDFRARALGRKVLADGHLVLQAEPRFVTQLRVRGLPWRQLPRHPVLRAVNADYLSGQLQAEGGRQPDGSWHVQRASWDAAVDQLGWKQVQTDVLHFAGDFDGDSVVFSAATWDEQLQLQGLWAANRAGKPLELTATARGLPLSRLRAYLPWTEGVVDGRVEALLGVPAAGTPVAERWWAALADVQAEATLHGLRDARGESLPKLQFRVVSPHGRPEVQVETQGAQLVGVLEDPLQLGWHLNGEFEQWSPQRFFSPSSSLGQLAGTVSARWSATGQAAQLRQATAHGSWDQLAWRQIGPSRWDWELTCGADTFQAEAREPRGVHAVGRWSAGAGWSGTVSLQETPLQGWVDAPLLPSDFSGTVSGEADLIQGADRRPRMQLVLDRVSLQQPPIQLVNREPVRIQFRDGTVQVQSLVLAGEGVWVEGHGHLEPGRSWNLGARGRVDMGSLARWLPRLERAEGAADLETSLDGPWGQPDLSGSVEVLAGAGVKIRGLPVALEDLAAYATFDPGRRVTVDRLDARVRDGRLHLEGGLQLDEQWQPEQLRFYTEIRDLDYQWPAQVRYLFDADALVTGTVAAPEIRGEVRLREFLYRKRIDWTELLVKALERRARDVKTQAETGIYLDLAVRGSENLRVENNLSDLSLAADLRVRGVLPTPYLWGRVDVRDGSVRFRGREYTALQSSVEFLGEAQPVPLLDLHARTEARDYTVNVDVNGPLDDYDVTLSSIPYLPHTDIVALLTLGLTTEELSSTGGVSTAEAASLISEEFHDTLEPVRDVFGIDTFHIDPSYSPVAQTTVPRVTVGKAVTEEIYARYSAAMGGEADQYLELEYTLNPRISLFGTWADRSTEEDGSLGGEVRFRIPFR